MMSTRRSKKLKTVPAIPKFFDLPSQQKNVGRIEGIVQDVITYQKSSSVILCGPAGCGKSSIVEQALAAFRKDFEDSSGYRYIYLDGMLQGDTKSSVDHILLELGGDTRKNGAVVGSAADKLRELCDFFVDSSTKAHVKGIILVIDRLEQLIAQDNQILLYNLFETSQQNKMPIGIIAMSSILEVLQKLEKRIMSRFSQLVLNVTDQTFIDFNEFRDALAFRMQKYFPALNKGEITKLWKDKDADLAIRKLFFHCKEWSTITKFCRLLYGLAGRSSPQSHHCVQAVYSFHIDTAVLTLIDLTHLQLALILSCFEYTKLHDVETFNFRLIHEHYLASKKTKSLRFSDHILLKSFLDLFHYGLLSAVGRVLEQPDQYRQFTLNISKEQLQNAVLKMDMESIPTDIQQWCSTYQ